MDADWDLQAVVRGCCSALSSSSSSATTTATTPPRPLDAYSQQKSTFYEENCMSIFPDLFQPRSDNSIEQFLNDLYNPLYFPNLQKLPPSPQSFPISPLSVLSGLQDSPYHHHNYNQHQHQQEKQFQGKQQSLGVSRCTTSNAQSTPKFKKR